MGTNLVEVNDCRDCPFRRTSNSVDYFRIHCNLNDNINMRLSYEKFVNKDLKFLPDFCPLKKTEIAVRLKD